MIFWKPTEKACLSMIQPPDRWCKHMDNHNYIPGVVQISITARCQCNCRHCGVAHIKRHVRGEPTLAELDTLFADLQRSGTRVIDLFGGEPTLRADLFDILSLAKSYGFFTLVETNGWRLDERYICDIKAANLDQVYLSLDDYREEVHDTNRNLPGLFVKATHALALCRKHDLPVDVSFVPKDRDYFLNHLNTFLDFVFTKGADHVRILLPRFIGNMNLTDTSPFSDGKEQELVDLISPKHLPRIYFHSNDTPIDDISVCSAKQYFCHIMTNGDVLPCPYLPLVFGNIKEESIAAIFRRIQESDIMRRGGTHCLARDISFIKEVLSAITPDKPFIRMDAAARA
ncbi:MAG: radical SAM protein [Chitinivibrionales bacterium]|nr:radical SAM protein [Chitinivibrionales bacterium]MBD3356854.1 radical SAM protein [Chitinivibrionales bacterium]